MKRALLCKLFRFLLIISQFTPTSIFLHFHWLVAALKHANSKLISMLQSKKNGKITDEKRRIKRNNLNNKRLWTSLKISVFATNFVVGCFHANYERYFVKKIFCVLIKGLTNLNSFKVSPIVVPLYTRFTLCFYLHQKSE